jgi:VanZ family protein
MRGHRSSAVPLAWLYAALIVYASLYPFAGWRAPGGSPLAFLFAAWTRWWTPFDVVSNLLGYLPLGLLVFGARLRSGARATSAAGLAVLLGASLSLAMETMQNFVPSRVPSTLDLAMNTLGAASGAALGWTVHALGGIGHWQTTRERWFVARSAGGIALLAVWPAALLFPTPVPLGVGQVLGEVQSALAGWLQGTSAEAWTQAWLQPEPSWVGLSPGSEVAAVALGLLAPAMVAGSISRPGLRRVLLVLATAACGAGATTLSTALNFGPQHAFAWLTPTAIAGFVAGTAAALSLAWAPARVAAALGLAMLSALIALVTQAPADPYFAESLQAWELGRFIRFHGAARWVGWFWPYAALGYLLARVAARPET